LFSIKTLFVLSALAAAVVSMGYYGSALAASVTQQSFQQSSQSSQQSTQQSSSQSSTVITTSNGSSNTVSSSSIVSSTGETSLDQDLELSGKIASSQVDLASGEVEVVLFGDWHLESGNGETSFAANFTKTLQSDNSTADYEIGNLSINSVQQINDSLALSGSADIASSNATAAMQDVPVTVMVNSHDGVLVVSFGKDTPASGLFGGMPLIGVVVEE
jgi:hypothetical protein